MSTLNQTPTASTSLVIEHMAARYKTTVEEVIKKLWEMQFPTEFIQYLGSTQGTAIHIKADRWSCVAGTNSVVPAGYDANTVSFYGSIGIVSSLFDHETWVSKDVLEKREQRYADIRLSFTLDNKCLSDNELKVCREAVDWYESLTPDQKNEKTQGKHTTQVAKYPRRSFWLDLAENAEDDVWLQIEPLIHRKEQQGKLAYSLCGKQVLWSGLRLHGKGLVDNTPSVYKESIYAPESTAAVRMKEIIVDTIHTLNKI